MSENAPIELDALLTEVLRAFRRSMFTALPGEVVGIDAADASVCDVRPIPGNLWTGRDSVQRAESYPVIQGVPLLFPRAGKFFVRMPVNVGDTVLLVFSMHAYDLWFLQGDTRPRQFHERTHDISDAIAIPGLYSAADGLASASATDMVIGHDDNGAQIKIKDDGTIELGSAAADFVANASAVDARISAIETFLASHVHAGVVAGGGVTGVAAGAPVGSTTAFTKVKAE